MWWIGWWGKNQPRHEKSFIKM
jgi:hypothetical protein